MDALTNGSLGARRNEDIALDLLKFVAATAGVGRPAAPSTGFSGTGAPKPEEHVAQLLDLYSRCLKVVEGRVPEPETAADEPAKTYGARNGTRDEEIAGQPICALPLPEPAPLAKTICVSTANWRRLAPMLPA